MPFWAPSLKMAAISSVNRDVQNKCFIAKSLVGA